MSWIEALRDRILGNLAAAPISDAAKEEIVKQAVEDTEAGRAFGTVEEEKKPELEDDPITSQGEKLSDLRKKARDWAGWTVAPVKEKTDADSTA